MNGARSPAARRRVGILAVGLIAGLLIGAPAALAAGAEVTGKVQDRTRGRPVAGIRVTLHQYAGGVEAETRTTLTDRAGEFRFAGLATGTDRSYDVTVRYEGVDYRSRIVEPAEGDTATADIEVFLPTRSSAELTVTNWIVWLDAEEGGTAVQHDIEVANAGKRAFVGDEALADGGRAVIRLPLDPGARDLQFLGIFMECCPVTQGETFVHTAAIAPGTTSGTVRYVTGPVSSMTFPVVFPTERFTLIAPASVDVGSDRLTLSGQTEDRGITYNTYSAGDLGPGEVIQISAVGLEGGGSGGTWFVVAFAALAGISVVGIALVAVRRRMRVRGARPRSAGARAPSKRAAATRRAVSKSGASTTQRHRTRRKGAGATSPAKRAAEAAQAPTAGTTTLEPNGGEPSVDRELLIEEIAVLDLTYERGLIEESTYRRLRAAAKARLAGSDGEPHPRGEPPCS